MKQTKPISPSPRRQVRIIGGRWRRSLLPAPDTPALRPTPDRVRQSLFDWLGQDLTGWDCLDAFAGTGALGLEAASRGAASVWLLEQDARLAQLLLKSCERLGADQVRVQQCEAVATLQKWSPSSLDAVFLDPPFAQEPLAQSALEASAPTLRSGGWLYLEAPRKREEDALLSLGLELYRYLKAGAVHAHLFKKSYLI